jgi:tetratricopeptide (TPR) repeat protein
MEEINGEAYRVCGPIRKYGNPFLFRLLFPAVVPVMTDDKRSIYVWTSSSREAPVTLTRFLCVTVILFLVWGGVAAAVGIQFMQAGSGQVASAPEPSSTTVQSPPQITQTDPVLSQSAVEQARTLLAAGNTEDARNAFRKAVAYDPANVAAQLGFARCSLQLGNHDDARKAFAEVLAVQPDNIDAKLGTADLLIREEAARKAADILEAVIDRVPNSKEAALLLAKARLQLKDFEAARRYADAVLERDPDSLDAVVTAAKIEREADRLDRAEQLYRRAIDLDPANREVRLGLVEVLRAKGHTEKAEIAVAAFLKDFPNDQDGLNELVQILRSQGRLGDAAEVCRKAINENPHCLNLREQFGAILLALGRYDLAYQTASELLSDAPGNIGAHLQLAALFLQKDLPTLTIEHCKKVLAQNLNVANAHRMLATAYLKKGDIGEAKAKLQQLMQAIPGDLDTMLKLADCYQRSNEPEKAAELLKDALKRHPNSVAALTEMGKHAFLQEHYEDALTYFEKAYELTPGEGLAQNNLAVMLAHLRRDLDRAQNLSLQALDEQRGNPSIADTAGWIYALRGKVDDALPLLAFAAEKKPMAPSIQFHYANALAQKGNVNDAIVRLERALKISTTFAEAEEARTLLEDLQKRKSTKTELQ